jgi:heme/copper-type cytochrome/quinol oxidase subunit 1
LLDSHHVERLDDLRDTHAFAIGFIVLFGIAGLTGLVLADVAADAQYHHSYFVVAHFHYALFAGGIMGVMTGVYYWLPKWTGHMYSEKLGKLHFWLTVLSFNLTFIPNFPWIGWYAATHPGLRAAICRVQCHLQRGRIHSGL